MIKIQVDNVKEYIIAKAMIDSFTKSEKLFYNLSLDFLLIKDEGIDVIKSNKFYKGENGLKSEVLTSMLYNHGLGGRKATLQDQMDFITSHKDEYDTKLRCKIAARSEENWEDLIKAMDGVVDMEPEED